MLSTKTKSSAELTLPSALSSTPVDEMDAKYQSSVCAASVATVSSSPAMEETLLAVADSLRRCRLRLRYLLELVTAAAAKASAACSCASLSSSRSHRLSGDCADSG